MHEHRSGEDQLYLAVHLKFNSKSDNCSASAMMKGRERKSLLWWYSDTHLQAMGLVQSLAAITLRVSNRLLW